MIGSIIPAQATIYDDDNLPAVTIANSGPVAEDAGSVEFTLTAGVTQNIDLDVAYTVQNEVGEYLGTQTTVAGPLQFRERNGAYVADISVQLDDDQVDEVDGSVSVILITDATYPFTYKVGAANKGIATITDNDLPSASTPKITLSSPNYIKEGASFDLVANASHPPTSLTTVNVVLSSDEDNNFLVLGSRGEKNYSNPAQSIFWYDFNHLTSRWYYGKSGSDNGSIGIRFWVFYLWGGQRKYDFSGCFRNTTSRFNLC